MTTAERRRASDATPFTTPNLSAPRSDQPIAPEQTQQEQRQAYRQMLETWRCALVMTPDLDASELRLALLMLQCSNRREFYRTGRLVSWQTRETFAASFRCHERTIQRARVNLEQHGIILRGDGGKGAGDPVKCIFNDDWLAARILKINAALDHKSANALAGQVPFITRRRETPVSPLSGADSRRGTTKRASGRETGVSGRETTVSGKGDTAMSPNPSDYPHEVNPLPSLRDGTRSRECRMGRDSCSDQNDWPDYALQWMEEASSFSGRPLDSLKNVCNVFAEQYDPAAVLTAMDYIAAHGFSEGSDPVAVLRSVIQRMREP